MANMKVTIELEVPENFKICENRKKQHEKGYCPFTYWDEENSCITCGFDLRDCPMKSMKQIS